MVTNYFAKHFWSWGCDVGCGCGIELLVYLDLTAKCLLH